MKGILHSAFITVAYRKHFVFPLAPVIVVFNGYKIEHPEGASDLLHNIFLLDI